MSPPTGTGPLGRAGVSVTAGLATTGGGAESSRVKPVIQSAGTPGADATGSAGVSGSIVDGGSVGTGFGLTFTAALAGVGVAAAGGGFGRSGSTANARRCET